MHCLVHNSKLTDCNCDLIDYEVYKGLPVVESSPVDSTMFEEQPTASPASETIASEISDGEITETEDDDMMAVPINYKYWQDVLCELRKITCRISPCIMRVLCCGLFVVVDVRYDRIIMHLETNNTKLNPIVFSKAGDKIFVRFIEEKFSIRLTRDSWHNIHKHIVRIYGNLIKSTVVKTYLSRKNSVINYEFIAHHLDMFIKHTVYVFTATLYKETYDLKRYFHHSVMTVRKISDVCEFLNKKALTSLNVRIGTTTLVGFAYWLDGWKLQLTRK